MEMTIFGPSHNKHPLTDHQKIWYRWLPRQPLRLRQIWCKSVDAGLLGKWVKYNDFFYLYLFFIMVRRHDGFSRFWLKRRGLAHGCAFWGFVDIAPHFEVEIPRNPKFWSVNRRFRAKRAKYWKFHVIETTAPISTKFCTTIETIKWSSRVVPISAQQIQYGGRPPFWKNR